MQSTVHGHNAFWTKIGAAWPHQDGKGFNIQLSCMPMNGRLVVRGDEPRFPPLPDQEQR
jgi:hypothetical protein